MRFRERALKILFCRLNNNVLVAMNSQMTACNNTCRYFINYQIPQYYLINTFTKEISRQMQDTG